MHLASGDRWAGAEVQLFTLLSQLRQRDDVEPRAVLLNDGILAQRLRDIGVPVDIVDESTLGSAQIVRRLMALLSAHRPDILHTHRQKENILGSIANAFTARARSVRTVHGADENPPRNLPQQLIRWLDRWTGRHLQQRIIAVSADLARKLERRFPERHIAVIENGIDVEAVRAAVTPVDFRERAPDAIHIGLVGRLDPVKRIDLFLSMAERLLAEESARPWQFHIFGEGALEAQLKQSAATMGIDHAVVFHGHRRDIAACLAALDAVVMCSDHEGLPMTALEAVAVGTPVVAHAVGGLVPLLADDAGGILVEDHSAAGYADTIRGLLRSDQRARMQRGMTRLEERYSAAANAEQMVALYRAMLPAVTSAKEM